MGHDCTAAVWLQTANRQGYSVIKTASDPLIVSLHEPAGLAFVA